MQYSEILKKRRSVRNYLDKSVSNETISEILRQTCLAPSSSHGQPWRFIVIHDRDLMQRLSDESKKCLLKDLEQDPEAPVKRYAEMLRKPDFNVFYNAPCLIYIAGPADLRSSTIDCSLGAAYLMFAAAARGLGTCWIGLGGNIRNPEIQKEIGLTDDLLIVAPIILGYPEKIPEIPPRKEPDIVKMIR